MSDVATQLCCAGCGKTDVRLYRPYGEFWRPERVKCNGCVPADQSGWYVPVFPTGNDGAPAWGFTTAPDDAIALWRALPEGDHSKPGSFNAG